MNTNTLVWNNKLIYKDFFNKYDLIISTPIHFPIIGDTSIYWNWNGYSLSHKLSLKNYIWINFSKKLEDIEFVYKEDSKSEFTTWNIENFYKINSDLLKAIWLDYDIGFLSEYNWINSHSFAANILTAILLINKEISIEDLNKLDLDNWDYQEILDKILYLDNKLMNEYNFFTNIRNNSSFLGSCILKSRSNILTSLNNKKLEYRNIWSNCDFNQLDLSISIINTNSYQKTNYSPKLFIESENILRSFCNKLWIDFGDTSLVDSLEKMSKFYSLKCFKNLHELYNSNSTENKFFVDVHAYRKTLKSIFKSFTANFIDIRKLREIILSYLPFNLMNIFIDHIWLSGAKLVVFSNKIWIIDDEFLVKINKSVWLNMVLDYSSFYDWFNKDWLMLEQYKNEWIVSSFCSWINVMKYSEDKLVCMNIEKKELYNFSNAIVLSKADKAIYIDWVQITSKDLKSQSFTIDLFETLFLNYPKELTNKNLPLSSYSKSKNEFTWKILIPLDKLLKDRLWKSVKIECKWSLENFTVDLKESEVGIYLY